MDFPKFCADGRFSPISICPPKSAKRELSTERVAVLSPPRAQWHSVAFKDNVIELFAYSAYDAIEHFEDLPLPYLSVLSCPSAEASPC
jgi:hypothetical protein